MKSLLYSIGLPAVLTLCAAAQVSPPFPAPKSLGQPGDWGRNIQRAMTLLATSTPERHHTVRVLFYGQSITEQEWWQDIAQDLRRRFPHANLVIRNRAIGGFPSQLLVKTSETDLYPFQPDLMIFYVYGSHLEYENIIKRTRQRTTADILIQTDHATNDSDLTEETDPAKLTTRQWTPWMNYVFLPAMASRYHCGLVDQRNLWKQYLKDTSLSATNLLKDGVHLNAHGNYLMAELVKAALVKRDDQALDPMNCESVKTSQIRKDLRWENGKLRLDFDGTRVDLIGTGMTASVRIDGRKPSEFPELYGVTRTTSYPGSIWPCLLRVTSAQRPQLEDWTLTIKDASPDLKRFRFELVGSKTGPDGEGDRNSDFVSTSRRVVISTNDWNFEHCLAVFKRPLPAQFKIQWEVFPRFVDELRPDDRQAPPAGIEPVVTVAHGLPAGRHTLEVTSEAPSGLSAIRIYRPSLQ
jgi:hypothetical protein